MPNLNHRFDWAQMGDKNMQISGIFSKIKMPNLNGGLCAAVLLVAIPAHAAYQFSAATDVYMSLDHEGFPCVTDENGNENDAYVNYGCACGMDVTPTLDGITEQCYSNRRMDDAGCRYEVMLKDPPGYTGFCARNTNAPTGICARCNCGPTQGEWTDIGSNRVSRIIRRLTEQESGNANPPNKNKVVCVADISTEYGCKEGYYTTAPTPSASMTCSPCPSLPAANSKTLYGKSDRGNTSITGCYQPAYTTFEDGVGQYRFRSECNYVEQ